jgi:hypothetical protein
MNRVLKPDRRALEGLGAGIIVLGKIASTHGRALASMLTDASPSRFPQIPELTSRRANISNQNPTNYYNNRYIVTIYYFLNNDTRRVFCSFHSL